MPHKPAYPCSVAGCRNMQPCPMHKREPRTRWRDTRPNSDVRGYGSEWHRVRVRAIREQRYCQMCGTPLYDTAGKIVKGATVHHRDHDPTNNEPSNLAVCCRDCHERTHKRKR